jgi:hypothetical protein
MNFRSAHCVSLFLTVMLAGTFAGAQSQSAGQGQPIVFSTPEGQIVSNAAVSVAQAPEPEEPADLPVQAPDSFFSPPVPRTALPAPMPFVMPPEDSQNSSEANSMDPMDGQKTMSISTPAKIMNVPTVRSIFGLPETTAANGLRGPAIMGSAENDGTTNIISSGEASDDPAWAKILAGNGEGNTTDSGNPEKSHGLLAGFFNGPPDDGFFGNQDKSAVGSGFGPSQPDGTTEGQSPFDSSLAIATPTSSGFTPPAPDASVNSALNTSSPFTLPQSSSPQTLPQLPTLPTVPGQSFSTPASVPTWEPKPAPWLSPMPQPGTMEQRKF